MARFSVNGMDELMFRMEELAQLPDSVLEDMLQAEADIVMRAQKAMALAYGVNQTGTMIASIQRTKVSRALDGVSLEIYAQGSRPNGKKKRKRNSEVAFINEFGKKGQKPRPFIADANEQAAGAAVDQAERIYDKYLKSKGF